MTLRQEMIATAKKDMATAVWGFLRGGMTEAEIRAEVDDYLATYVEQLRQRAEE